MPKLSLKSRIIGHGEEAPDNLTANPLNFRRHPKEQLNALRGSMKELGWIKTVIVNKRSGYVLDGHARVEEAIRQGLPSIPVTYVDLDENEEKLALAVLDPITELAYRDDETLKLLLDQANASDQDLKDFLLTLNNQEAESGLLPSADEDEVPEPPKKAITKLGDLITLGNHRLLCGDATKIEDVEKLMDGKKADMVFTDPPYGIDYQSGMSKGGTATRFNKLKNDNVILNISDIIFANMNDNSACFIWTSHSVYPIWRNQFDTYYKQTIIWHKGGGGIGDLYGSYAVDYELALFCVKGRVLLNEKRRSAVWKLSKDNVLSYLHPTQKPVELAEAAILDLSNKNNIILDLFGGSGSTLIACEKTNRHCYMMELDPIYCDVIIERWEKATGKKAQRV